VSDLLIVTYEISPEHLSKIKLGYKYLSVMIKKEGRSIKTFLPIYLVPNWATKRVQLYLTFKLSASIKGLKRIVMQNFQTSYF
jgi:hypothetical protein